MVLAALLRIRQGAIMNNDLHDPNRALKEHALRSAAQEPTLWTMAKAHPIGMAVGVVGGGAIGLLCGIAAGPVGSLFGAVVGALLGALAACGLHTEAGSLPDEALWRQHHAALPGGPAASYEAYRPAYRAGAEAYRREPTQRDWSAVEAELAGQWVALRGSSPLPWSSARVAAHKGWQDGVRSAQLAESPASPDSEPNAAQGSSNT
jgi:hypothetical protein